MSIAQIRKFFKEMSRMGFFEDHSLSHKPLTIPFAKNIFNNRKSFMFVAGSIVLLGALTGNETQVQRHAKLVSSEHRRKDFRFHNLTFWENPFRFLLYELLDIKCVGNLDESLKRPSYKVVSLDLINV